uniref:Putative reverse transcriptase n=1 Tax=Culex quinquefasciatus TaxID=7176 RepID=F5HRJ0_CULQU|nr:putative reverse transcriptase [Culex quinquefasciatus]
MSPKISSTEQQNANEILIYCQNFNRMKSPGKMKEISLNILSHSFDIILGTETNWDESVHPEEIFGNNYFVFLGNRNLNLSQKKSGGGVLLAINARLNPKEIVTEKHFQFEQVWAKATIAGQVHIFASVYFKTVEIITSKMEPEVKLHIYGDFNQSKVEFISDQENEAILLPVIGENETLHFLFDNIANYGLFQINHVKNQRNSFLDLLFTNCIEDFHVQESVTPLWKNEVFHTAIEYSIYAHKNTLPIDWEYEEVLEYNKTNFVEAKRKLLAIDWQNLFNNEGNVEELVGKFYTEINTITSETVPTRRRRRNNTGNKYPVWFTPQLRNLKNRKQKAYKLYRNNTNDTNLLNYLNISDQFFSALNSANEEYNSKVESEVKSCPKNFFNYVKSKSKSSNFPSQMQLDENVGSNSKEICNLFSKFFKEVYTSFSEEDRDRDYFSYIPEFPNDVSVNSLSETEVRQALKDLDSSKGPGPDGIAPAFLKNLAEELTFPLHYLFNMSINNGKFPQTWKKSFLVPIFKSGPKSDIRNYRGIALLSCIPKLFESIINEKIFQQVKNRITCKQNGFFKGRSTSTNLLEFVNFTLNAMHNRNFVEAIYTDFSKAFDRIDIPLLIFKLQKIGIQPNLLEWLKSYLTKREQIVRFQNVLSESIHVTSGVPQGSHLGPLLFILYVNDISFILKKINVLVYADDMKLYMEIGNANDSHVFQNEINLFYTWCSKSLLQFNVNKCNSIAFSRKHETPNITVLLGNQPVEKCKVVRDLGVILDSQLTFVEHYNTIINKAKSTLGFIKRFAFNFQDPYTIKLLYITYVRPLLEYCSIVWNPYYAVHQARIESVQKQFLLYALRKLNWTAFPLPSYEARCMLINIQSLQERRKFAMLSFINDIISQRIQSAALLSEIRNSIHEPSRTLRHSPLFRITAYTTNYLKNSPLNQMMRFYNENSQYIHFDMSKPELRKNLYNRNNI